MWLISAPGESTPQKTWDTLNRATSTERLSTNYKFNIPDLRVNCAPNKFSVCVCAGVQGIIC